MTDIQNNDKGRGTVCCVMWGRDCDTECITVTTADVQVGNKLGVHTNVKVIGLTTPAAMEGGNRQ